MRKLIFIAACLLALTARAAPFALCSSSIATRTTGQDCATVLQDNMVMSRCLNIAITACPSGTLNGSTATVANTTATAKVTDPTGTSTRTVVLVPGGDGGGQWAGVFSGTQTMLNDAVAAGARVIQLAQNAPKWGSGTAGFIYNSARSCTQLKAIHDDTSLTVAGTPLIVVGQSGGSSMLAYCMAFFGAGDWIDTAVFMSGPPHGYLYGGIFGTAISAWSTFCAANTSFSPGACIYSSGDNNFNATPYGGDGSGGGTYTAFNTKSACGGTDSVCTRDSFSRGNAVMTHPQTDLQFIYGDRDSSSAVPLGKYFRSLLISSSTQTIITQPGGHNHTDVPNDAASTLGTIIAAATFRH